MARWGAPVSRRWSLLPDDPGAAGVTGLFDNKIALPAVPGPASLGRRCRQKHSSLALEIVSAPATDAPALLAVGAVAAPLDESNLGERYQLATYLCLGQSGLLRNGLRRGPAIAGLRHGGEDLFSGACWRLDLTAMAPTTWLTLV